jgi:predicted MFS family arabinose efflux permease
VFGAPSSQRSLRTALATSSLRRLQLAWACSALGSWTLFIALAVYAEQHGGATAVSLAALARMLPAAVAAPLSGLLCDRRAPASILLGGLVTRAILATALAVVAAAGAALGVVLVLAALFMITETAHRPAQAALLRELAADAGQAGAAIALWTGVDNAAFLGGSLLGGAVIAIAGAQAAFSTVACLCALAAIPMATLRRRAGSVQRRSQAFQGDGLRAAVDGLAHVARTRELREVVGFLAAATLVEGAVDVLLVVVAVQLLHLGDAGVGWLNAAWGLGGLLGGALALALPWLRRDGVGAAAGGVLVGASLMAVALLQSTATAVVMLIVLGVGYALIEAASLTMLHRETLDDVLGRAFAVVEGGHWLATALGALAAPLMLALLGPTGALWALGACLPLIAALRWRALARPARSRLEFA